MSRKYKVIIDMDIGDDIDDAIALYSAMKLGFDIIGVTTVFQNTEERARMTKKMLKTFGNRYENTPVYVGYGDAIDKEKRTYGHTPHYSSDLDLPEYTPDSTDPEKAIDFIVDSCRKYGKELVIIAIGAFTNIAHAIMKDAEAVKSVAKVAIMGGAYLKQYADWNVMCDVLAADIMFKELANLECIGADVTHKMIASDGLYESIVNYSGENRARKYLKELCDLWKTDRPTAKLILHDPLVVYYVSDPALCVMKKASVAVVTDGYAKGMTLNVDAYSKKWLNTDAYIGFDDSRKILFASDADREEFNKRIIKDFE